VIGDGLQSGGGYQQALNTVGGGIGIIFGNIAANKNVRDLSIDYDDVVVESTNVDNQQVSIAVATLLLMSLTVFLMIRQFRK
jgi:hypothetical protein